ncbi:hypothetical protein LL972_05010 [Xanthomonas campestris pv. asclepiadis]|uniref:hypothetical protein n=1 Tax=Xanthomonas campestris TaxID=339 RepID=UPI001E53EF6B|nr:hypothetical protein [Xanthomonas campestris]MCC4615387.1 hypothetical protein [Xanthomonas campestris pv. asclepiadis]
MITPVHAGIGAWQEYLGQIQCSDGFEKSITAWALIAQLCRKQAQETNVLDSPAGQIAAFQPTSLMRAAWMCARPPLRKTHETGSMHHAPASHGAMGFSENAALDLIHLAQRLQRC